MGKKKRSRPFHGVGKVLRALGRLGFEGQFLQNSTETEVALYEDHSLETLEEVRRDFG